MISDNAIALIHAASAARRIGLSVRVERGRGQLVRIERIAHGGCIEHPWSPWLNGRDLLKAVHGVNA